MEALPHNSNRPERAVLTVWRILLMLAVSVPALFCSLLFPAGALSWWIATGLWVGAFLFFYLFYLPIRYRRLAYYLKDESLLLHSGVFYDRTAAIPLGNVQYVVARVSPLDRLFGLCTLVVVAPGGRMRIPGLRQAQAKALSELLR